MTAARLVAGLLLVPVGYAIAVAVAVLASYALMMALAMLPRGSALSLVGMRDMDLPVFFQLASFLTAIFALPGFVLSLIGALSLGWHRWHSFGLAGTATAVLALVLLNVYFGMSPPDMNLTLALSCLPAGFIGGAAYWFTTGRIVHRPQGSAR